jgi:lipid II:glycine glycyltransferase (peptidoglycan interpeptide bridge formation enzyme)
VTALTIRLATADDRPTWDAFVASRPDADPLQSWAWGEANVEAGEHPLRTLVTRDDGRIAGVAQVLVRPVGFGRSLGYVPHGPVWQRDAADAGATLDALVGGLREISAARRIIVVKVDPRATPGTASDVDPVAGQLAARGLTPARHDLQARTTRLVDVLDGGDRLWATWTNDARRLVRRSAREGVVTSVDRAGDPDAVRAFRELLVATSARGGFRVRSEAFLATLATELGRSGGWFLTLARLRDRPIAGVAALRVGDRAYYVYGASLREEALKHAYGAYAALAATMRAVAGDGVRVLDMWGVVEADEQPQDASWAGFSAFKRQFGGTPIRHPGTFDLVVSPRWHAIRDLRERLTDTIHR